MCGFSTGRSGHGVTVPRADRRPRCGGDCSASPQPGRPPLRGGTRPAWRPAPP